jgi:predicted RNA binding protein YcfA (HicA-like mRNA interferase family)
VPRLPRISGRECVKALEKLGFVQVRHRGSHVVMCSGERGCAVPLRRELKTGTLRGILKQADLSVDEFIGTIRE